MTFKGTKEPWFACCIENSPHYVFANEGNVTICKPYIEQDMCEDLSLEEYRANALLISKAPEMLEMLQKDIEYLEELAMCIPAKFWTEEFRDKWNKEMHEKEQLIKEATEIN